MLNWRNIRIALRTSSSKGWPEGVAINADALGALWDFPEMVRFHP